jgi:preprotein translocase subunit SecD
MVMGFALTLVIGIAISMFTAVVATRVLLRLTAGEWATGRPTIFGVEERKDVV